MWRQYSQKYACLRVRKRERQITHTYIYINIFFKEVNFLNAHLTPTFSEANIGCCL